MKKQPMYLLDYGVIKTHPYVIFVTLNDGKPCVAWKIKKNGAQFGDYFTIPDYHPDDTEAAAEYIALTKSQMELTESNL